MAKARVGAAFLGNARDLGDVRGVADLRASTLVVQTRLGRHTFLVLSVPSPATSQEPLTASEEDVHDAILRGRSNREIAALRGTSERTVANQVASLMRKLGVGSRAELVAWRLAGEGRR